LDQDEIIEGILASSSSFEKSVSYLYTAPEIRNQVIALLKSKGLKSNDSETLWADIVVKFSSLVVSGKYKHQGKMIGFINNLARYMFLNHIRDNKKYTHVLSLDQIEVVDSTDINVNIYNDELKELFSNTLSLLGEKCKSVLTLWSRGYKMNEIMKEVKIISPEATRKQKHSCMKKLLSYVADNIEFKNMLKEFVN
jgi:hypothetical protein|tara:strand:+ start:179 stop:766 length:588 start_codon:yes stop_codon:yes gene_type:complete